ncbi:MAG: hypothetical protein JWR69_1917, partial [Pedosphaera sp.]|nr:hypothetical protein [Pedosphaera sp.]
SDKRGSTAISLGGSFNFTGSSADFARAAYSPKAKAQFGKLNVALSREQKIYQDWSLLLRASGQAASGPLISNEQVPLGGVNSVRGYFEGDEYGDSGWFGSAEARTPSFTTRIASVDDFVPTWVRGSVFLDGGQRFLLEPAPGSERTRSLLGAGFGLSANVNNHLDFRVAVGWPLLNSANTRAGQPHAYFTIGAQF